MPTVFTCAEHPHWSGHYTDDITDHLREEHPPKTPSDGLIKAVRERHLRLLPDPTTEAERWRCAYGHVTHLEPDDHTRSPAPRCLHLLPPPTNRVCNGKFLIRLPDTTTEQGETPT